MVSITIITPTYNRGKNLNVLYKSLLAQTNNDFKWLIMDDGSIDNTNEIVREFIKENKINIVYLKKHNGGKHTALNYAMNYIDTELTFIVDSDDYLTEDAIEEILIKHEQYKKYGNICGYSFLRMYPNGEINDKCFPSEELIGNYIDVRINGGIGGDKAEVFYTKCLKKFPFPEINGEKFIGEDIVWIDMALKYDMVHINKAIYISQYLEDGLTKNRRLNNINSPKGCIERAKRLMYRECNLKTRIKGIISYIVYSKFDKRKWKDIVKESYGCYLFYVPAIFIYIKWKIESSYKGRKA